MSSNPSAPVKAGEHVVLGADFGTDSVRVYWPSIPPEARFSARESTTIPAGKRVCIATPWHSSSASIRWTIWSR
jgi:hypothetical protein